MAEQVLRYAGFAEESEYAEDPSPTPDVYADIASSSLDVPSDTEIEYEGGLTRGSRLHRPGFYVPSGNVVYAETIDTLMRPLRWTLGGYTFTADGGQGENHNLHEMYAEESAFTVPTFATRIGKDVFEHLFRGCAVNSFQLDVEDGFVQTTLDLVTSRDEKGSLNPDAIDGLASAPPFVFHEVTASLDGVDESAKIRSLTLSIENSADPDAGRSLGSRWTRRVAVGQRTVTLEMSVWYDSTEHIERVWGGQDGPSTEGSSELPVVVTLDAGEDGIATLTFPRVVWTAVSTQPSGQSRIEQTINAKAYLETQTLNDGVTEVYSEILAAVENKIGDVRPA